MLAVRFEHGDLEAGDLGELLQITSEEDSRAAGPDDFGLGQLDDVHAPLRKRLESAGLSALADRADK